ncbi:MULTISPECIES: glycerophosphodiester phosphodiesterase family protein [unclassified Variovorax]|jgi:glycerophosphoryl diester phosphodiesterase|uniref:glycerophosphodiester phosphodiesterase family protein n=1 Tax=unclassified Variovorax TaxID=663243 RepID=UPI000F7EC4FB|nr:MULTISPECIES: glycerophosphodiester phosphodiesterase family protein [unclassified Variovorax]RSZ46075.1 glycerophosphodiester phosphodiesterase [Variovorax sp. 553]RSZ46470.1 glycerophosphodiester phosphodiesterase [Variovorax sp. 679]
MRRVATTALAFLLLPACGALPVTRPVLPIVVAHRAGTADAPENTLDAIRKAVAHGADAMWLSVQLSKDAVPMLYRPADLSALTDASGPLAGRTAAELARVNAGWHFRSADGGFPYRDRPVPIPTLREALRALPPGMPVMLDMKALPAGPLADAVAKVLAEENAWSRTLIYSTDAAFAQVFSAHAQARLFESRDATRGRLASALLNEGCVNPPASPAWAAFELHRKFTVIESFTLGEGASSVDATLWTPATVACFRSKAPVKILAIAVDDARDYRAAACLGIDAVLTDSPLRMAAIRSAMSNRPLDCPTPGSDASRR